VCTFLAICSSFSSAMAAQRERTFIMVKPDGVMRGLVGKIITRFEEKGLKLVAMKFMQASEEHLKLHYADLSSKPFFAGLVKYMSNGPVCAMAWEGNQAAKYGRLILGATHPQDSAMGTVRGDFCVDIGRNVCHGSDSPESGAKEIALWFKDEELISWTSPSDPWVYE